MAGNWNSYICKVNGSVASIFLDFALKDVVPMPDRHWLLWVWLYLRKPRKDGLSDAVELNRLVEIENCLSERMLESCGAILSGSITTEGRREFYYYGSLRESFEATVQSALCEFDGYRFDCGAQEDRDWNQYLNILYPSKADLERVRTRDAQ
jgi:hypothetical protein